jgi:hypothetical protein
MIKIGCDLGSITPKNHRGFKLPEHILKFRNV